MSKKDKDEIAQLKARVAELERGGLLLTLSEVRGLESVLTSRYSWERAVKSAAQPAWDKIKSFVVAEQARVTGESFTWLGRVPLVEQIPQVVSLDEPTTPLDVLAVEASGAHLLVRDAVSDDTHTWWVAAEDVVPFNG